VLVPPGRSAGTEPTPVSRRRRAVSADGERQCHGIHPGLRRADLWTRQDDDGRRRTAEVHQWRAVVAVSGLMADWSPRALRHRANGWLCCSDAAARHSPLSVNYVLLAR